MLQRRAGWSGVPTPCTASAEQSRIARRRPPAGRGRLPRSSSSSARGSRGSTVPFGSGPARPGCSIVESGRSASARSSSTPDQGSAGRAARAHPARWPDDGRRPPAWATADFGPSSGVRRPTPSTRIAPALGRTTHPRASPPCADHRRPRPGAGSAHPRFRYFRRRRPRPGVRRRPAGQRLLQRQRLRRRGAPGRCAVLGAASRQQIRADARRSGLNGVPQRWRARLVRARRTPRRWSRSGRRSGFHARGAGARLTAAGSRTPAALITSQLRAALKARGHAMNIYVAEKPALPSDDLIETIRGGIVVGRYRPGE